MEATLGSAWELGCPIHGTASPPRSAFRNPQRLADPQREGSGQTDRTARQTQGQGQAGAHQLERRWSGTGRALRRSSANGPPGAPGALLSRWAAGAPHPAGAEEAPPPSGPGGGGRPAPGLPSRPTFPPSRETGQGGQVPARIGCVVAPPAWEIPGSRSCGGSEGTCFPWRKLALLQDGWWEDPSPRRPVLLCQACECVSPCLRGSVLCQVGR